jgi:uncharacterized protein (DUF885 family)
MEYIIIEDDSHLRFINAVNQAAQSGCKLISSNAFYDSRSNCVAYYAMMAKESTTRPTVGSQDYQFKVLEELHEINYQITNVVKNLKYLSE